MKKSIIATGAASLALAAMPVVGVFAARSAAGTITDTLNVNIPAGCTIVNGTDALPDDGSNPALENSYTVEMQNGEFRTGIGGSSDQTSGTTADNTINVSCNTGASTGADAQWVLTAQGAGTAGHTTDLWNATASQGIATAAENLQASESLIRDTDMASAIVDYTKNQILTQSGTAMLAQANTQAQNILSLIS